MYLWVHQQFPHLVQYIAVWCWMYPKPPPQSPQDDHGCPGQIGFWLKAQPFEVGHLWEAELRQVLLMVRGRTISNCHIINYIYIYNRHFHYANWCRKVLTCFPPLNHDWYSLENWVVETVRLRWNWISKLDIKDWGAIQLQSVGFLYPVFFSTRFGIPEFLLANYEPFCSKQLCGGPL